MAFSLSSGCVINGFHDGGSVEIQLWFYYGVAVLVLTASPGPSVLLCVSKSVTRGFRSSVLAALGSLSAIYVILTLSFTGLGVIIARSEVIFEVIKWLGSAYLVYLGVRALTSKDTGFQSPETEGKTVHSPLSDYASGFLVGASNPKAIVFFTALFPQFINPEESLLIQYAILAGTFVALELSWLMFYSYLGRRSTEWLMQEGRARWFNRITGGVFVSAGVLLSNTTRASG